MKTLDVVLVTLLLASGARAQAPAAPAPASAPAEDPLLKQLLDRDRVRNGVSRAAGGVRPVHDAFWGNLGSANAGGAVATAQDFLKVYGPLLGFTANFNLQSDVAVIREKKGPSGTHVVFAPAVQGVPYMDAQFAFDTDPAGNLVGVQGRYDAPTGARMATIDVKTAVRNAIREIGRKFPGLTPSRGGFVQEYLELTEAGAIEHRFGVSIIVGDHRRQRRVVIGVNGEVVTEGEDDHSFRGRGE